MTFDELCETGRHDVKSTAFIEEGLGISWAALLSAVDVTVSALRRNSIQAGECVAVKMPNSPAAVAGILACIHEKLLCLLLDHALKPPEVALYCERARAQCMLSPAAPVSGNTITPPDVAWFAPATSGNGDSIGGEGGFLLLSSGSSGQPKLVVRTMAQTAAALDIFKSRIAVDQQDRVFGALPFFHSFGLLYVLLSTIRAGAALIIEPFSPRSTIRTIVRERVTILPASPFMFRMLAQTSFSSPQDLRHLRLAVSAGSALTESLATDFRNAFGVGIAQSYGTTETGPAALGMPDERSNAPGWVGRPYGGVSFQCPNLATPPKDASECASLVVRSPANASGYLDAPEATALVFGGGGVVTGDLGYSNAYGDIFVLGRERPMIAVAGKKVAPSEVEACLRSHPRVVDVLVTSAAAGDGGGQIRATVVAREPVSPLELREYCAPRLADFKIPREFVFTDTLGEGPMGKTRVTGGNPLP